MNFQIFEDQENAHGNAVASFADARKERAKLAPLTNKAINNENAFENQVRPSEKFCLPAFSQIVNFFAPRNRLAKHKSWWFRPRALRLRCLSRKTCSLPLLKARKRWSSRKNSRSRANNPRSWMLRAEKAAGQPAMLSTRRILSGECVVV